MTGPLSRDELLAGLSGRRVSTALYAVETRTAYLDRQARHAAAPAICEAGTETQERAFLAAVAAGRDGAATVTIQQIERFAPQWAHLAPTDAVGRAELAHRLGAKYRFTAADVPRLRTVLGLDDAAVRAAYRSRHGGDIDGHIDGMYRARLTRPERLAWRWARLVRALAEIPPFWAAFGLTLTETIGAGTLALPIALAGLGPLPGIVAIAVLGLVNVLTVAALAETFTRSGRVRWSGAYLSRLVGELLGPAARWVFTAGLFVFSLVALTAYYVGFATSLTASTGLDPAIWAAVLFVVVLVLLRRGGLDATIASALLVGAVNIAAILLLSGLALARAEPANLLHVHVPLVGGAHPDPAVLGLVFGSVLFAFFGHTSVGNCARVVLQRDPGGRSLLRGSAAATLCAIVVYGLWVLAVGGAVDPQRLAREPGTALVPLAEVVGAPALVIGTVFAVLALGMAAVHFSLGLYNQVRDWSGGTWTALLPMTGVFVAVEVLLLTGHGAFTGPLGVLGTVTLPLLAGVFPVLLLATARRRGECLPAAASRWRGNVGLAVLLYMLFLGALLVYGLLIWEDLPRRVLAVAVAVVVLVTTVVALRGKRLVPRVAVEIRGDAETGALRLHLVARGEPLAAPLRVRTGDGGQQRYRPEQGRLDLPAEAVEVDIGIEAVVPDGVRAFVLRLHEVDPAGRSVPLRGGAWLDGAELELRDGVAEAELPAGPHELRLHVAARRPPAMVPRA